MILFTGRIAASNGVADGRAAPQTPVSTLVLTLLCTCAQAAMAADSPGGTPGDKDPRRVIQSGLGQITTGAVRYWLSGKYSPERCEYSARFGPHSSLVSCEGNAGKMHNGRRILHGGGSDEGFYHPQTLYQQSSRWEYGTSGLGIADSIESHALSDGAWSFTEFGYSPFSSGRLFGEESQSHCGSMETWSITCDAASGSGREIELGRGYERLEWTFATGSGQAAVHAAYWRDGKLVAESKSTLGTFDGLPYPTQVSFFEADYAGGQQPVAVFELEHGEFNRPGQPLQLSPADLGLEVGGNVYWRRGNGGTEALAWDGSAAVPYDQFREQVKSGAKNVSPRLLKYSQKRMVKEPHQLLRLMRMKTPTYFESEWRQHTSDFVRRYALDREQSQAADRILEDCVAQAHRYLDTRKAEFEKLQERWEDAKATTSAPAAAVKDMISARRDLLAPIDRIFEERLKPRLETLPTPAQRAKADRSPVTSQPK